MLIIGATNVTFADAPKSTYRTTKTDLPTPSSTSVTKNLVSDIYPSMFLLHRSDIVSLSDSYDATVIAPLAMYAIIRTPTPKPADFGAKQPNTKFITFLKI